MTTDLVQWHDCHATTTSLIIAEKFGKRHKNVLRDIEKLIADCASDEVGQLKIEPSSDFGDEVGRPKIGPSSDFGLLNFEESSYLNQQNKPQPMYFLTRDAFSLLVMGFTGKEALAWKLRFIAAFNALETALRDRLEQDARREAAHQEQARAYWFAHRPHWRAVHDLVIDGLAPPRIAARIGRSVASVRRAIHRMIEVGILHPRLVGEALHGSAFSRRLRRSGVMQTWGQRARQLDLFGGVAV
jgi:phage regulator Rha-like protein